MIQKSTFLKVQIDNRKFLIAAPAGRRYLESFTSLITYLTINLTN